ncbi:VENN motif pre-toxin domain-containing protein, partial [Erwiniaceae bacterium L1_54_6]|nr:VENN motif pre-toxin domain-containing protein [Erwiniaceae bacterium L1_54_6]
ALGGLSAGNIGAAASGAMAPYIANEIKQKTTTYYADGTKDVNVVANTMAHAVAGAVLAQLAGNSAAAGAAGAASGELIARAIVSSMYPDVKDPNTLTESQKQTVSALSQLAAGLAGGMASDSAQGAGTGAVAGKNAVENNYLSSSEKSRQTYLNLKKNLTPQEQQERDVLNRKDMESDLAVVQACLSSGRACDAEREKARDALDTYINQTYQNPKEAQAGYQQIQNLLNSTDPNAKEVFNVLDGYTQAFMLFGYTEDEAKARAGAYVGSIYISGGVSTVVASGELANQFGKDVAPGTKPGSSTAKPIEIAPNSSETYFRVEGGGSGTQTSQNRINVNSDGSVTINSGCSGQLCVSTNGPNHAVYYLTNSRQDGSVVVFEVDAALNKQIMDAAVPQRPIPGVPKDPDAPKIVDPTKGQPSVSLELPKVWHRLIELNSSKARVLTKEEFLNEFNK